jgi:hypothetical protein
LTTVDDSLLGQGRFLLNSGFLASKIEQYAREEGIDLAECGRIEVCDNVSIGKGIWWCHLYSAKDKDKLLLHLEINKNGKLLDSWNIKKMEEEHTKTLAEIKALEERVQKLFDELETVDFLIQPIVW